MNQKVRALCLEIREIIREISESSGVPIEPAKQTELLNELMTCIPQDRLLYAGIPGAGGDDAIFALGIKSQNSSESSLSDLIKETFCKNHPDLAVLPVNMTRPNDLPLYI